MTCESPSTGRVRQLLASMAPCSPRPAAHVAHQEAGAGIAGCRATTPLGGATFGARIEGIDLSRKLSSPQAAWLQQLLWEHGVLHVPAQHALPAGGLERLANYFGAPVPGPGQVEKDGEGVLPQVLRSEDRSGNSAAGWHTDLNFQQEPCTVTMLHCLVAPLKGGGTQFASTSRGYASLPARERVELAKFKVAHLPRPFFSALMQMDPSMTNVQPLVRPHPQTGRPALYLPAEDFYNPRSVTGWTSDTERRRQGLMDGGGLVGELLGLDGAEADRTWQPPHRPDGTDLLELAGFERLRDLMLHCVQTENTAYHQWQVGDIVIWCAIQQGFSSTR